MSPRLAVILLTSALTAQTERQFYQPLFPSAAVTLPASEIRELLTAACDGGVLPGAAKHGCNACPATSGLSEVGNPVLNSVTLGRFTDPPTETALLSMQGCESHSMNFGGTFVLDKRDNGWRRLSYLSGIITTECFRLPPHQGREALLCSGQFGAQQHRSRWLFTLGFDDAHRPAIAKLLTVWGTRGFCGRIDGGPIEPISQGIIESVSFPDLDGDQMPDLSVQARSGDIQLTPAEVAACEQRLRSRPALSPLPLRTPLYRLGFIRRGARLDPTPATRKLLPLFKN